VVQNAVEQNERNIQFFLIEDTESRLRVLPHNLSINMDMVLAEQARAGESFVSLVL